MFKMSGSGMRGLAGGALAVMLALCLFEGVPALAIDGEPGAQTSLTAAIAVQEDAGYDIGWYVDDSESDEFLIENAAQLRGLSALVNGTASNDGEAIEAVSFEGKTIYLGGDIDLSAGAGEATGFTPIGSPDHPFAGMFDGDGHGVANLRIDDTYTFAGLFGYASSSSVLRNVVLGGGESGVSLATDSKYIGDVGTLAGKTDGEVLNCSSSVGVTVESSTPASASKPYTVQRVGGLVGYARGNMDGCSYTGDIDIAVGADALDADSSGESLRVADSFGGVVGRFGDPDMHGTLADSYNLGDITVKTTGAGAVDRFGTLTHAVAFYVGGVTGYSNGSVLRCHNGAYDENTRTVTGKVFTGVYASDGTLANNRGADEVGGIAGSLRGNSERPDKYNDGDPDDLVVVSDCYNEAQITGLNATGGIVGQAGVYTTITRCYNGTITDLADWTRNQEAGKVITTRWNKPLSGGIVGQTRSGIVSYCANYAEVRNIQTGYYMAGIAGCIFTSDDYPGVTGEIYSCFNSGGVYTINTSSGVEYREAGICGDNEGYVHDCIVMEGSVPYHQIEIPGYEGKKDAPIGGNDWGATSNLYVKSPEDLAKPESAAILNAIASQTQDWSAYWFINGQGYPVLNTWVAGGTRTLTADIIASVEQLSPAPYVGPGSEAMPTLEVTLTDGTVLVQDTDFRVIPQPGAYEMSAEPIYSAGIEGLGMYTGTVPDCASYGIAAADLSMASVQVSPMKYQFGKVVFPTEVKAVMRGHEIDSSEFEYVIYGGATSAVSYASGSPTPSIVLDSEGYVSFDAAGNVKIPFSQMGAEALNASNDDWWLWDRDGKLLSDSKGNGYYTFGNIGTVYESNYSCTKLKSGTPSGYIVEVKARSSSAGLSGKSIGYYVIEPVNLYRECVFEYATIGDETWYWDVDKAEFYRKDAEGDRIDDPVSVTFTGEPFQPVPTMSCGNYQLVMGQDIRTILGDPNPDAMGDEQMETGSAVKEGDANRNVTGAPTQGVQARAAITIVPIDTANLSNYINAYFEIVPADFADCDIELVNDSWAYTGQAIEPDVRVALNGVVLERDKDYEVAYANNVEKGKATYSVTPLANLQGGSTEPVTGSFQIVDGIDLSSYSIDEIADQQFNWGYDVHPELVFRDAEGAVADLVEGRDYAVTYSTAKVTKRADGTTIDPCTATVTGSGVYTGSLTATFDIVPYDAEANATNQLRVLTQNMAYGTWGKPATATVTDPETGEKVLRDETVNVGVQYPVISVLAYPIVDWAAYESGDTEACYGDAIVQGTSANSTNGGLINRYPVHYFDLLGNEVNGNGAVYADTSSTITARPAAASPGPMTAQITFRTGTSGDKGGAVGTLTVGTSDAPAFVYTAPADLSTVDWAVSADEDNVYDGDAHTPIIGTTKGSGYMLVEGEDYKIVYGNNVDAGVATYTVSGIEGNGLFSGAFSGAFSIMPLDLSEAERLEVGGIATQSCTPQQLADEGATPEPTVSLNGVELRKGVDYRLYYQNNHTYGDEAYVFVSGMGNYTGVVSSQFSIVGEGVSDLGDAIISGLEEQAYDGTDHKLVPVVELSGEALTEGYTVTYLRDGAVTSDFVNSGIIEVLVKGDGVSCIGSKSASYTIAPAKISGATVFGLSSYTYDGEAKLPAPTVKLGGRWLAPGSDFTLTLSNNRNAGTASVKVTGLGNYTGVKTASFTIAKAAQPLTAKAKAAKVKVKLAKVRKKAVTTGVTVKVTKAQGKVTYKNVSAKKSVKKWKVKANGKVVVPKGTKKGTYKVKLRVTAAGNSNYNSGSKTVSFKIVVK